MSISLVVDNLTAQDDSTLGGNISGDSAKYPLRAMQMKPSAGGETGGTPWSQLAGQPSDGRHVHEVAVRVTTVTCP